MDGFFARFGKTTPLSADIGLLVLRVWFGVVLAAGHGLGKITDVPGFTEKVKKMGFILPELLGPVAALSEFAGGLLMAAGLLTRAASASVLVTMLTAAAFVHADDPFGKKEFALAYGVTALAVLISGPGRFSFDAWLARRSRKGTET